ncbi:MAG: hypothetical protein JJE04_12445 [Acidobacteriia bacterium]|nr:hypothetical protein [Terriglobia bacterium]
MSALTNFTGPTTPEGKARSSMNALKHGFSSKKIIVMSGQEDDFQKLQSDLIAEVRPEGAVENTLFHQLLRDAWTLHRVELHRVELQQVEMAESGRDPLFDPACEKQFDRIERYHARAQGGFHRSIRQLRAMQTNRIVQTMLPEPLDKGALPALVKATEIVALAKRTHKSWNALAINTLIEATKRSRETSSPRTGPQSIVEEPAK